MFSVLQVFVSLTLIILHERDEKNNRRFPRRRISQISRAIFFKMIYYNKQSVKNNCNRKLSRKSYKMEFPSGNSRSRFLFDV